jgi:ubiquitin C-terminal hydrolase
MRKEEIGNIYNIINYSGINMNNENYKYDKIKISKNFETKTNININKNLTNNLTLKNKKCIKTQRYLKSCINNKNDASFKNRILRNSNFLFKSFNEKKNNQIIHIKTKELNPEKNPKKTVKKTNNLEKKDHQNHEIDITPKKWDLNNNVQSLGNKDKINNDINQEKSKVQRFFESILRNPNKMEKEEMYDENTQLLNSKNRRNTKNNQSNNFPFLNCGIQKRKKEKNEDNDNLSKNRVKKDDDDISKYKHNDLKKANKENNYKKNKYLYNGRKNIFQNNIKKDEKKPIDKFTNLEKSHNLILFSIFEKNKDKIFSILKNIEFFVKGKEKKNKKNMTADDKIKEFFSFLEEYDFSENEIKELLQILIQRIKPLKNQSISIDRFEILGENFNQKNSINFDNAKIKKTILDEMEQKNANDNIASNNYNNDEIDYKGNGNFCGTKNKNTKSKKRQEFEEEKKNEKIEKEEPRILKMYGFINRGNDCYLNSSLQLLTRIKDLKDEVFNFNENYEDNDTQGRLIIEFKTLLQQIEVSKDKALTLDPRRLKRVMGNVDEKYKFNNQEDSNEFIANFISALLSETGNKDKIVKKLNIVNESDKRPYDNLYKKFFQRKGYSFVLDLFYGIIKVTKKCNKCDNINSIKFNVFNMLELPLYNLTKKNDNKELNLKQLFCNFTEEKKYEEACNNCKSDNIYSKTTIYTLPQYLIISFGRICEGNYYSNNIHYPKNFKIKSEFEHKDFSYILECVIEHSGGLGGGHYTSLIPTDKNNDNWIRYSDSYCSGNSYGFESRNAIILLYKLK